MKKVVYMVLIVTTLIATNATCYGQGLTWFASGNGGVVAAGPPSSAQAGIDILSMGGNAVDGAVAVIFNLAVSDYGMFSIGGEVPFMYYDADVGKIIVYNGMGGAPKNQKAIDWYYENGIPGKGIKAATVPSAVSTCLTALEQKGTMSFAQVISPTLYLLDSGRENWYKNLAITLRKLIETEKNSPGNREQKIRAARDRFYKGDIADELNEYYISSGGFLRKNDLETHTTNVEEPVSVEYRGYSVNKCNTWTQGPVLLQSLRLLENFNLKSMNFFSADYIHVVIEAMKLAYADRDKYYGDPGFVKVPLKQLLSDQYTKLRYPLIDLTHASQQIRPGDPVNMLAFSGLGEYWPGERGTTTCVVTDKWGNVVAATPSSNPDYGICENLGIAHNTRLSSLNTQEGHPNSLEPGKRPRITLTPTIVLKDGKPVLAMSVAGGDMQDQVSLQIFLNFAEFGMMPKKALSSPRFLTDHMQDSFNPDSESDARMGGIAEINMNATDETTINNLIRRGHKVNIKNRSLAYPAIVYINQETGVTFAASQPTNSFRGKCCASINLPE